MQREKEISLKKKTVPTLKQQEWIRQTMITKNPTEAARMTYNVKDNHNAAVIASENLSKPYLRQALNRELERYNLILEDTVREHKWVIGQRRDLPTKLRAIQEHYEILGMRSDINENKGVNIALVIE